VIQEHSATRLHWDLRLEHDGALSSWAVPNGIPDDPKQNRKAVRTEEHPLDYLDFEGDIPKGNYGAGTLRIWDRGTYELEKWEEGKVVLTFHGKRVRGRYSLFQTGPNPSEWMIHRMDPPEDPARDPLPADLVPMLARPGDLPRDQEGWAFEIKWDGVRALAYGEPGRLTLRSRNQRDITSQYPEVHRLNRPLGSRTVILDGEIVAFDDRGRPSFERLQERMHLTSESVVRRRAREVPAVYVLFDLLYLDGHLLLDRPYRERRKALEGLGLSGPAWQTPAAQVGQGDALLKASAAQGLEGLIAKRLDSPYEPGRRSPHWIKVKNTRRQELVVGGWLAGEGRRTDRIGALLVGYYDDDGLLRYAGRVGSGFTDRTLTDLSARLRPLRREASPFVGRGVPKGAVFCEPRLVVEVEFSEWTRAGILRHPRYKGLRDDKDPIEVRREDLEAAAAVGEGRPGPAQRPRRRARKPPAVPPGSPADLFDEVREVPGGGLEVTLEGRRLKLSNWDKVLYPAVGFTKGDLIAYYARIAPAVLPHLRDRPLTLKRYPNGVESQYFYEKQCPEHRPEWVQTAAVSSRRNRGTINFCLVQDAPTLVWAANLADIELHTSLSLADPIDRPTMMVFDLDPGAPASVLECCEVGLVLRGLFAGVGLESFVKTSGSKGLQVYLPLNSDATYSRTKPFARQVAEMLEGQMPDLVVSRMTKSARAGKVLVDWSQNDEHKTTVCVYSVRAMDRPLVSTPLTWDEVEQARAADDPGRLTFDTDEVLERVARDGDLFAPLLTLVQELPAI
jgi:bifunctional non-homologous end joining protein LigD